MQQISVFGTTPGMDDLTARERVWLKELGLGAGVYLGDEACELKPGFCTLNTMYYCMQNPKAEIVNGWVLWKSKLICELEFHSVVRVDGRLIDITKRADGEKETLFFEDVKHWSKLDKGFTQTFHNIIFPKIGRNRKTIEVFGGDFTEVFRNFAVKARPALTQLQQEFLREMASQFLLE